MLRLLRICRSIVFLMLFLTSSAHAQSGQIVGEWTFIIAGNQPWTISSYDPNTGAISGTGAANGYQWTFTGTAKSGSFSINYIYTNLPSYFGTLTATFADTCTLVDGTWTSSFGQVGTWTGSKPGCTPGSVPTPTPADGRSSAISMFCNRIGPNLNEASCAVTVGDSGAPPRKTPTGTVEFAARNGFFPGAASCLLQPTAYSPGVASCIAVFQVPFGFPIATPFPIDAVYNGDATFTAAATAHELIQAGCIGTPDAPCSGAVALSFADIPQIINGALSSVVSCGGATPGAVQAPAASPIRTLPGGVDFGECAVDLEGSITAAEDLSNIEDPKVLEELANQIRRTETNSLTPLESVFLEALARTSQLMARNQEVYNSHIRNSSQIQETIRREMQAIGTNSPQPAFVGAAGRRVQLKRKQLRPIPLLLSRRSSRIKANTQRSLSQKPTRAARVFINAMQAAGVGSVNIKLTLRSQRSGKLPKGVRRKATISSNVVVGLTSLR